MKNPKLQYYSHAGESAFRDKRKGIICGWDIRANSSCLIMAVTEGKGWPVPLQPLSDLHIVTLENNPQGYYFIELKHILKS